MSKEGWTKQQKDEIKLVLESLTIADGQCRKFIADNGYREWAHCGILDKCVQDLELKVAGWDTGGNRCLGGYIHDEIASLYKVAVKSDFQCGMEHAFMLIACKCSERCG